VNVSTDGREENMTEQEWEQSGNARLSKTGESIVLRIKGELHFVFLWQLKSLIDGNVIEIPVKMIPRSEKKDE
jgi:hypothetical protein